MRIYEKASVKKPSSFSFLILKEFALSEKVILGLHGFQGQINQKV
jgi:hypothetical protein